MRDFFFSRVCALALSILLFNFFTLLCALMHSFCTRISFWLYERLPVVCFFPFASQRVEEKRAAKARKKSKNNELQLHVNKQLCTFIIAGSSSSNSSQVFLPMQNINSTHMSHYTQFYMYHRAFNLLVKSSEICFTSTS